MPSLLFVPAMTYAPGSKTAFVFIDNGFEIGRVPPWAMKVVLDEDRIMSL